MDGEELLSLKEVASRLKVSEKTIRRMIKDGRFPDPVRIGTSPLWHAKDCDAFIWLTMRKVPRLLDGTEEIEEGQGGTGRD